VDEASSVRSSGAACPSAQPLGSAKPQMPLMAYSVSIVVSRNFGQRLRDLSQRMHVWVCDTPPNRRVAESCWQLPVEDPLEQGVTTFKVADSDTPEAMLLEVLDTVDLHHGTYSHDPPWDSLLIIGCAPTPAVRKALAELGVDRLVEVEDGFECSRSIASAV
jgi:hypothetical protein